MKKNSHIAPNATRLVEEQAVLMYFSAVAVVIRLLLLLHMLCDQIQRAHPLFLFFFRLCRCARTEKTSQLEKANIRYCTMYEPDSEHECKGLQS